MNSDAAIPNEETNATVCEEDNGNNAITTTSINKLDEEEILKLTIKNLDTGEQYIIGENDPDFDFDTFELRKGVEATPIVENKLNTTTELECDNTNNLTTGVSNKHREGSRYSLWRYFFGTFYSSSSAKKGSRGSAEATDNDDFSFSHKTKTPFTKLSNFKFRKELGRGAFGRVLLAESKADGKLFALKIITKKNMRSSDKRQAKAERDILHAMTLKAPHPFTSGLKFAFQSENNLYLGMDYIPGGNLRELIKKFKFLPEDWVRFYAAELVLAISHLHSMNVLYRDIKPHNVMIDGRGHAVLIDFGLSKQEIVHPRGALSLVGTPDYSAPEVLKTGVQQIEQHNREKAGRGKGSSSKSKLPPKIGYGKAADWWSLGIMIYEMLSGTPTFRGTDLRQTYQKILYAELDFYPEERFSMPARLLLAGLIKRDPSTRLGAWENPPQDIMSSSFFDGIKWDRIYERSVDGPFIPEPITFSSGNSRKFSTSKSNGTEDNSNAQQVGDGMDAVATTKVNKNSHKKVKGNNHRKGGNDNSDDDSDSELQGMRDSVFIRPHDGNGNNLLDWSFIDEKVLVSSIKDTSLNPSAGDSNKSLSNDDSTSLKRTSEVVMPSPAVVTVDRMQSTIIIQDNEPNNKQPQQVQVCNNDITVAAGTTNTTTSI